MPLSKNIGLKLTPAVVLFMIITSAAAPFVSVQASQVTVQTVGTTTSFSSLGTDYQIKTGYAAARYWVFYFDGANLVYTNSQDGENWEPSTILASAVGGQDLATWFQGSMVYYVRVDESHSSFWYRYGTLTSSGSILWAIPETQVALSGAGFKPSITVDSASNIWIAVQVGAGGEWIYKISTFGSVVESAGGITATDGTILPFSSGKVAFLYLNSAPSALNIITYDSGAWSEVSSTPMNSYSEFDAVTIGDDLYVTCVDTSHNVNFILFRFNSGWQQSKIVASGLNSIANSAISTDGSSTLAIVYGWAGSNNMQNFLITSSNLGSSWNQPVGAGSSEKFGYYITAPFNFFNNNPYAVWNVLFGIPSVRIVLGLSSSATTLSSSTSISSSSITSTSGTSTTSNTSSNTTTSSSSSITSSVSSSTSTATTTSTSASSSFSGSVSTSTVTVDPTVTTTVTQTVTSTLSSLGTGTTATVTQTLTPPISTSTMTTTQTTSIVSTITSTTTSVSTVQQLISSNVYLTCDQASISERGNTNCQAYAITLDGGFPGGIIAFSTNPVGSGSFTNEHCSVDQQRNAYFILSCDVQYRSIGTTSPEILSASYSGNTYYSPSVGTFYLAITPSSSGSDSSYVGGSSPGNSGLSLLALIPGVSTTTVSVTDLGSALAVAIVVGVPFGVYFKSHKKALSSKLRKIIKRN